MGINNFPILFLNCFKGCKHCRDIFLHYLSKAIGIFELVVQQVKVQQLSIISLILKRLQLELQKDRLTAVSYCCAVKELESFGITVIFE